MDRWMGKTVTVAELGFDEQGGVFRIEEEPTWVWRFKDVDFVIINKDPNFLFRQKKAKEKES